MGMHHTVGQFAGANNLILAGRITTATPAVAAVSNPSAQSGDVTVATGGTAIYNVTVKNFKGPQGVCFVQGTAKTIKGCVTVTTNSYSGEDLSLVFKVTDDTGAALASDFDFLLIAS